MATVGSLSIDVGAKIAGFERNLDKAARKMDAVDKRIRGAQRRIEKGFKRMAAGVAAFAGGLLAGGAIRAIDQATTQSVKFGDELGKAAKTAGVAAEELQVLRLAAERTGTSQKQLDDALGRFTRRLGLARDGNVTYAKSFEQLGVTMSMNNSQAIKTVIDNLSEIEDLTVRTARATIVFGDDARHMGLLAGEGGEGIAEMANEFKRLGLILSNESVAALEEANDRLTDLDNQLKTRTAQAIAENIEGLIRWRSFWNSVNTAIVKATASLSNFAARQAARAAQARSGGLFDASVLNDQVNEQRIRSLSGQIAAKQAELDNPEISFRGKRKASRELEALLIRLRHEQNVQTLGASNPLFRGVPTSGGFPSGATKTGGGGASHPLDSFTPRLGPHRDLTQDFNKELTETRTIFDDIEDSSQRIFESGFLHALRTGEYGRAFKNMAQEIGLMIFRMTILRAISTALFGEFGGGAGGGSLSVSGAAQGGFLRGIFGNAAGGRIPSHGVAVVGERGTELVRAGAAGASVTSNRELQASMGGAPTINVHFDQTNEAMRETVLSMAPILSIAVTDGMIKARTRSRFT